MSSGQVSPRAALTAAAFAGTTLALAALALAPLGCATDEGVGTSDGGLSGGGTGGTEGGSGGAAGAAGADAGPAECRNCPEFNCYSNESPGTACARQAGHCTGECLPIGSMSDVALKPTAENCFVQVPSKVIGCVHPLCPQEFTAQATCVVEVATDTYFPIASTTQLGLLDYTQYRPCTHAEEELAIWAVVMCPSDAGAD